MGLSPYFPIWVSAEGGMDLKEERGASRPAILP